jgi:23S rRNA pseudouridine2605 synthase
MTAGRAKISLARALSKLGFTSRSTAVPLITGGRVRVNGKVEHDPNRRIDIERDKVSVDSKLVERKQYLYMMLNKPRGTVTSRSDERGRQTVFHCFKGSGLPFLAPVGRLDKESEGMLLFSNDTRWANRVTAPESHIDKTYRVEIDTIADDELIEQLLNGVIDGKDHLAAKRARVVRSGDRSSWVEIVLDEGKNRHIRRLFAQLGANVLTLRRVAIGKVKLGGLGEGKFRELTAEEREALGANAKNEKKDSSKKTVNKEERTETEAAPQQRQHTRLSVQARPLRNPRKRSSRDGANRGRPVSDRVRRRKDH